MVNRIALAKYLLATFKVDKEPDGVFELGCCTRPQTIHSQQQRAFNFVWALQSIEKETKRKEIAVIGGGISGLTVAAGLLAIGHKVTVFERMNDVLHLQHGCLTRVIHPNVSKWLKDPGAGYPLTHMPNMNWQAGPAGEVNEELRTQWKKIEECFEKKVKVETGNAVTKVGWNKGKRKVKIEIDGKKSPQFFDIAVLSVGYGVEVLDKSDTPSYWRNDDLGQLVLGHKSTKTFLVSGTGDGGLIEVLRLKIRDFQHDEFINNVLFEDWVVTAANEGATHGWANLWKGKPNEIEKQYPAFFKMLRNDTDVILNSGADTAFDTNAQEIHLVFVSLLLAAKKIKYEGGRLQKVENGKAYLEGRKKPLDVDVVVQRHNAIEELPRVHKGIDTDEVRKKWEGREKKKGYETFIPHYKADFLADELMSSHCESEYEIGFGFWEQGNDQILANKILTQLKVRFKSDDLLNLAEKPFEGVWSSGTEKKRYRISSGKFELITFSGADPQTSIGVRMSSRRYQSQEFEGLVLRTNSRSLLETLLDGDNLRYNLLRIYLDNNFPQEQMDWFVNTSVGIFLVNFRGQSNCIEIHCKEGMYQAHNLFRYPRLLEVMKNTWRLNRLHGWGWAAKNSLQVNRTHQRGNELVSGR